MRVRFVALPLLPPVLVLLLVGCTGQPSPPGREAGPPASSSASVSASASPTGPPSPSQSQAPTPGVRPGDLDVGTAARAVEHLAGTIGPRHATSAAHRRTVRWLARELRDYGFEVRREPFDVPSGDSWGVQVPAGRAANVVAEPPAFDASRPHLVIGAHLDTVPQAPGAEDNASGVGVLLAVAEAVAGRRTRLPVVLVAFGAEEPRGPGDDDHHYGSRHHVAAMAPARRRSLRAMVSLDRVGVGARVPVCSAGDPGPLREELLTAAARARVPVIACTGNRSSDHWSFVRAGLRAVRLGSTPYAGYHSPADEPGVVQRAQLERTGRIVLAWLGRGAT